MAQPTWLLTCFSIELDSDLHHHRACCRNHQHHPLQHRLLPLLVQEEAAQVHEHARQGSIRFVPRPAPNPVRAQHPWLRPQVPRLLPIRSLAPIRSFELPKPGRYRRERRLSFYSWWKAPRHPPVILLTFSTIVQASACTIQGQSRHSRDTKDPIKIPHRTCTSTHQLLESQRACTSSTGRATVRSCADTWCLRGPGHQEPTTNPDLLPTVVGQTV